MPMARKDKLSLVDKRRVNSWSPLILEALTARSAIVVEGTSGRAIVEATPVDDVCRARCKYLLVAGAREELCDGPLA